MFYVMTECHFHHLYDLIDKNFYDIVLNMVSISL